MKSTHTCWHFPLASLSLSVELRKKDIIVAFKKGTISYQFSTLTPPSPLKDMRKDEQILSGRN